MAMNSEVKEKDRERIESAIHSERRQFIWFFFISVSAEMVRNQNIGLAEKQWCRTRRQEPILRHQMAEKRTFSTLVGAFVIIYN